MSVILIGGFNKCQYTLTIKDASLLKAHILRKVSNVYRYRRNFQLCLARYCHLEKNKEWRELHSLPQAKDDVRRPCMDRKAMRTTNLLLTTLSRYHPVVIEGMGYYDPRDPSIVAQHVHEQLERHWQQFPLQKPPLVITQGDPLSERGISAITPRVAELLGVSRGLVCLDPHIASYHAPNADRDNVILELRYSDLARVLDDDNSQKIVQSLTEKIDFLVSQKNEQRKLIGIPSLKDYFRDFALLQEVTKAACRKICGNITVAHTAKEISQFSVTSFYQAGLELGLVQRQDMVPYAMSDELDFHKIDKR